MSVNIKCQHLFSLKNNKINFKMTFTTNLLSILRVNRLVVLSSVLQWLRKRDDVSDEIDEMITEREIAKHIKKVRYYVLLNLDSQK